MTVNREVTPRTKVLPAFRALDFRTLNFRLPDLDSAVISPFPDSANRMRRLGLRPDEFEEVFSRSSGPGGQNVNKVSTAVTLLHRPSGMSVTVQETRSQYRNRQLAMNRLITLIEETRKRQGAQRRGGGGQRQG